MTYYFYLRTTMFSSLSWRCTTYYLLLINYNSLLTAHYTTHYWHWLLTTHYSLLTTGYLLFTTYYSLLTTHHSLLTAHRSLLTTHYSLFTTRYSPLTTHYLLRYVVLTTLYSQRSTYYLLDHQNHRRRSPSVALLLGRLERLRLSRRVTYGALLTTNESLLITNY